LLPPEQDQEQWNMLARQWLMLADVERMWYYQNTVDTTHNIPNPSDEQIERALKPFQTAQERNLMITSCIWLRTCYDLDLESAYQDTFYNVALATLDEGLVFDDADLYNYGASWQRIFERIPSLCDYQLGGRIIDTDYESLDEDSKIKAWVQDAVKVRTTFIFLVDRQALLEGLITVLWLDCHGECVWWYRVEPENFSFLWYDSMDNREWVWNLQNFKQGKLNERLRKGAVLKRAFREEHDLGLAHWVAEDQGVNTSNA
jgi:hypothetical protein